MEVLSGPVVLGLQASIRLQGPLGLIPVRELRSRMSHSTAKKKKTYTPKSYTLNIYKLPILFIKNPVLAGN